MIFISKPLGWILSGLIDSRYFIGDYSVEGHEDSVAVERKEGRG